MADLGERINRALKPDAQAFDEVRIVTVPRYKESGLSGDEWRIHAAIQFYRKGQLVHEAGARNVESACAQVGYHHANGIDEGCAYFAGEGDFCDQEGCSTTATVTYRLLARYANDGTKSEPHGIEIRKFCDRHKVRGDCGLDDADRNYEPFASPAA